jgi:hypothetical protein
MNLVFNGLIYRDKLSVSLRCVACAASMVGLQDDHDEAEEAGARTAPTVIQQRRCGIDARCRLRFHETGAHMHELVMPRHSGCAKLHIRWLPLVHFPHERCAPVCVFFGISWDSELGASLRTCGLAGR